MLDVDREGHQFAGATKVNRSILAPIERRVGPAIVRHVPPWLETQHLTLLTLLWSAMILVFSALATRDLRWLWGASAMVALQWLTDHVDGKVGKLRGTGLVRWGYYMDHLLDYVFLCAIAVGYSWLLPAGAVAWMLVVFAIFGAFMVHTFLVFSATERFEISTMKLGPTEFRLAIVVINTLVIRSGPAAMARALPWVAAGGLVGLAILVWGAHREIWSRDMAARARADREGRTHP
jgi:phosphatidylglycerophosphate synthase